MPMLVLRLESADTSTSRRAEGPALATHKLQFVFLYTLVSRAGLRHVRGVQPNRAAKFMGPQFWTLQKLNCQLWSVNSLIIFANSLKLVPPDADFKAKMHQIRFRLGLRLRPRPRWRRLQRSPRSLAVFEGSTSKRRERGGEKGKGARGERGRWCGGGIWPT